VNDMGLYKESLRAVMLVMCVVGDGMLRCVLSFTSNIVSTFSSFF